jgi:hypothetical protein
MENANTPSITILVKNFQTALLTAIIEYPASTARPLSAELDKLIIAIKDNGPSHALFTLLGNGLQKLCDSESNQLRTHLFHNIHANDLSGYTQSLLTTITTIKSRPKYTGTPMNPPTSPSPNTGYYIGSPLDYFPNFPKLDELETPSLMTLLLRQLQKYDTPTPSKNVTSTSASCTAEVNDRYYFMGYDGCIW